MSASPCHLRPSTKRFTIAARACLVPLLRCAIETTVAIAPGQKAATQTPSAAITGNHRNQAPTAFSLVHAAR
jgi:hypothetical protein